MGIDVQLRSESGEVLAEVHDRSDSLARATRQALVGTRLLKYLVPWGNAIFNQAQALDLEQDIASVKAAKPPPPLLALLIELEPLVERLQSSPHVYLWFIGD
jgi:hypothetical protein